MCSFNNNNLRPLPPSSPPPVSSTPPPSSGLHFVPFIFFYVFLVSSFTFSVSSFFLHSYIWCSLSMAFFTFMLTVLVSILEGYLRWYDTIPVKSFSFIVAHWKIIWKFWSHLVCMYLIELTISRLLIFKYDSWRRRSNWHFWSSLICKMYRLFYIFSLVALG